MPLQALQNCFAAAPATDPLVDIFSQAGVRIHFAPGEEIFAQEDEAEFFYCVVGGSVRTTRLLSDGRRQIGDFYYPGDLFGIETGDTHRFSAEALETCEILITKRSSTARAGEEAARLERLVWEATARELARTQEHLMLLGRKTAWEKVATFLLDLADRFRGETTALPMGRQDIADYLGLTIETVSRMLSQLQAQNLVEFSGCRRFRIMDRGGLARMVAA